MSSTPSTTIPARGEDGEDLSVFAWLASELCAAGVPLGTVDLGMVQQASADPALAEAVAAWVRAAAQR